METKTPTMEELSRLKPNAKGDLYLNRERMATEYMYAGRLGRHWVCLPGEPLTWKTEAEARAAAQRFCEHLKKVLAEKSAKNPQA